MLPGHGGFPGRRRKSRRTVSPFDAWQLPPGFELGEEEVVTRAEGMSPFRHPSLTEGRLLELAERLRFLRRTTLQPRPVGEILEVVDQVARRFLDLGDPLRQEALVTVAAFGGYSRAMVASLVDGMAREWRGDRLRRLLRSEFPDPRVLDGFVPGPVGGRVRALGYPLTFHLGAGAVPGVATTSMIRALLVKSAVLLKPGLGDLPLPVLFTRGLREEEPELAQATAVLYWPGEEAAETAVALGAADLVVAYGSDETVAWVRSSLPPSTPLRGYRHRMGFGIVGRGGLGKGTDCGSGHSAGGLARKAAKAVATFDQKGCVSPHVIFVEEGGDTAPEEWAALLAAALRDLESELPSGSVPPEAGAAIQQLRGVAEMNEAMGTGRVHHGGPEAPWTVLFHPEGPVEPACSHRTVRVIPVRSGAAAVKEVQTWGPYLQTVGLAGFGAETTEMAEALAGLGVSRVVPLDGVPWPPAWWHHDGTGPLQDLVRWTDLEPEEPVSSETA